MCKNGRFSGCGKLKLWIVEMRGVWHFEKWKFGATNAESKMGGGGGGTAIVIGVWFINYKKK